MNIHEYQAKQLLHEYGVPVPKGNAAHNDKEVEDAIAQLDNQQKIVVKAQIHAGGRGKGTFTDGFKGGVQLVDGHEAAKETANRMLGNTLVTQQTGTAGRKVQTVYFTEACDIQHEYYLALVLDRETAQTVIIASTEGGMDIEAVADKTPEKIIRVPVSTAFGLRPYHCRRVAFELGFNGDQVKQFSRLLSGLYKLYWENNAMLVEINPLITTESGDLVALDAKMTFDGNAIFYIHKSSNSVISTKKTLKKLKLRSIT